ncbi:MAG TPA: hypothetical protein VIV40_28400 [Kofleriaceae bacterium]
MKNITALLALVVIGGAACTDDAAPPDNVLELQMQATIPAATELEYCKFVQIPDAWVTHDTIEFTAGSHHVLVYQTPYTSIPTAKNDGTPVDTSGVFDCSDGATNGWSVTKLIGGSQNREGAAILRFPAGVGVHVGGVALINVHYVNTSDETLQTDVRIKFDTLPADQITQEGDILFLYNPLISVPPNRTARAQWSCPVYRDITISNVQSHMHIRGVGYEARVDDAAPFYSNTQWERVPVENLDMVVHAGSRLDYHCDYRNTEARQVYQGPRTSDEMCMLIGSYYPADPRTAFCLDESGQLPGGNWVGQGAATCQQTMGCLQGVGDNLGAVSDCVMASKPDVSIELSAALRCFMSVTDPFAECGAQITACGAK